MVPREEERWRKERGWQSWAAGSPAWRQRRLRLGPGRGRVRGRVRRRAHRGLASYRGEGSVKAWLCGIARHVCARVLETRQRSRDAAPAEIAELPDGDDAFAIRRRARAIRRGLDQLRPSEREVLILRYVADLGHREIATTLQIDEAAARKRLSRALAPLRTVMCDQEID